MYRFPFLLVDTLSCPLISGTLFIHKYFREIFYQQKYVLLTTASTVAIVATEIPAAPWGPGDKAANVPKDDSATLTRILVLKELSIAPFTQQRMGVVTKLSDLV